MARYLILGAGKFGRLALERLGRGESHDEMVVVDHRAESLVEAQHCTRRPARWVQAEVGDFLAAHLTAAPPWDWVLPMIPVHVAFLWLRSLGNRGWETAPVPAVVENLTRQAIRGPQGELYLSRACHRCPDDCDEPPACPVSGESRGIPLHEDLAHFKVRGFKTLVIPCSQLAPGVGGYPPRRLLDLAREAAAADGQVLVATACRCHGVVHALRRRFGGTGEL